MAQQNFLANKRFDISFTRLPNVEFFVQNVSLPGIATGSTPIPTPFATVNRAGDKLTYEDLTITVRMDENMRAYKEIHDWMVGLTKPKSFSQYNAIAASEDGLYSDMSVFILNSKGNVNLEFRYIDVFPTNIDSIQFDTTGTDNTFVTCNITFKYTYFDIIDIYLD